ncbi:hypothetical protein [Aridibaculum aurantiacum]|uniref:hypothetical protein n=1 Tax=Aridibaculum aurantiacum TaxID=2810307 RepID=UPI001A97C7E5|nr:hypothetical protein [Aridibaculum aurantiacum]
MSDKKNHQFSIRLFQSNRFTNRNSNYKCQQDEDDGKYYCYRRVQGRWVQCNGVPYDTPQECEEALKTVK